MQTESIARRARFLRLSAMNISSQMRSGSFRSLFRGHGMEFAGVREYLQGDDVRAIDWNVTSRMGKPFVKLFNEEREISVFLIVDRSLSMTVGSGKRSRLSQASETAALLAFAAEQHSGSLGAALFHGELECILPPAQGRSQVMTVIRKLDSSVQGLNSVHGSALSSALAGAGRILRSRSLVAVISDFRVSGYEQQLALLARKHDVLAIRITDPLDTEFPAAGYIPFYDPETGLHRSLPTSSPSFRREWETRGREHLSRWYDHCIRRGAHPLEISTESDPASILGHFFAASGAPR
jgi:uncharacterized protein (DUF58 family)